MPDELQSQTRLQLSSLSSAQRSLSQCSWNGQQSMSVSEGGVISYNTGVFKTPLA